jgi:hypothetical protein
MRVLIGELSRLAKIGPSTSNSIDRSRLCGATGFEPVLEMLSLLTLAAVSPMKRESSGEKGSKLVSIIKVPQCHRIGSFLAKRPLVEPVTSSSLDTTPSGQQGTASQFRLKPEFVLAVRQWNSNIKSELPPTSPRSSIWTGTMQRGVGGKTATAKNDPSARGKGNRYLPRKSRPIQCVESSWKDAFARQHWVARFGQS